MPVLDPQASAKLGTLQSLDDAIAYRLGRLEAPCQECGAGSRCIDHQQDEHLIAGFTDRALECPCRSPGPGCRAS